MPGRDVLYFYSFGPEFLYHIKKAVFVDGSQSFRGYFQGYPPVFLCQEKALALQVGQKSPFGLYVGMGNLIA